MSKTSINPFLATVAQPGQYSERSYAIDDSNDKFYCNYDHSKKAIMRYITSSSKTSTLFIKYINMFAKLNGLQNITKFLKNPNSNKETLVYYTQILKSITDFLIEDEIMSLGPDLLISLVSFALQCTEKNLRETSQEQLQDLLETIENLALRLMSRSRCHRVLNYILLKVFFICLNSDILDKQNFAMKIFTKIDNSLEIQIDDTTFESNFDENGDEMNTEQESMKLKEAYENTNSIINASRKLEEELIDICNMKFEGFDKNIGFTNKFIAMVFDNHNIFWKIIKSHQAVIQKSTKIIKLLFSTDMIDNDKITGLWELMTKAELDTRTNLLSLLKESTWQMTDTAALSILQIIQNEIENEILHKDILDLVVDIRRSSYSKHSSNEIHGLINEILWMSMNNPNTSKEVFKNSLQFLIRFTISDNNYETAQSIFEKAIKNLLENNNYLTNLKIISKILKETKFNQSFIDYINNNNLLQHITSTVLLMKGSLDNNTLFVLGNLNISCKETDYCQILKKSFKFVWKVTIKQQPSNVDVSNLLFSVWTQYMCSEHNSQYEHIEFNNYIQSFVRSVKNYLDEDVIERFLEENLEGLENLESKKLFDRFEELFMLLNLKKGKVEQRQVKIESGFHNDYKKKTIEFYILNVPSRNLSLFPEIKSLFFKSTNKILIDCLCAFITNITTKPEYANNNCNEIYNEEENSLITTMFEIYKQPPSEICSSDNKHTLNPNFMTRIKTIMLIKSCLGNNERRGFGNLISLASLKEGNPIVLSFEKENRYQHRSVTKIFFKEETTLFEVRTKLSSEFSTQIDLVGIRCLKTFDVIGFEKNNMTLAQLHMRSGDVLEFFVMDSPEKEEEKLTDKEGELTTKARAVFEEIFEAFSTNGKMSKKQLTEFTRKATDNLNCTENDERILSFMRIHDTDNDGFIELDRFIYFYTDSSRKKKSTVFNNLKSLGYGKDLILKSSMKNDCGGDGVENSVRFKLMDGDNDLLDKILDDANKMLGFVFEKYDSMSLEDPKEKQFVLQVTNWFKLIKEFIYIMPPSMKLISQLISSPQDFFHDINSKGESGQVKITILHSLLFKSTKIKFYLKSMACNLKLFPKATPPTSNTNLTQPQSPTLNPTSLSLSNQQSNDTFLSETTSKKKLSINHIDNIFDKIGTCIDIDQNIDIMVDKFIASFFESSFFDFVNKIISFEFNFGEVKRISFKLVERGLLLPKCEFDFKSAKSLGLIVQYNRLKKTNKISIFINC